jgi:hypothetical protein
LEPSLLEESKTQRNRFFDLFVIGTILKSQLPEHRACEFEAERVPQTRDDQNTRFAVLEANRYSAITKARSDNTDMGAAASVG